MLYIYKYHKDIIKILVVFGSIYILSYTLFIKIPIIQGAQSKVVVTEVLKVDDYTSCYGYYNFQKVKVVLSAGEDIKEGYLLILNGEFREIEPQTIPGNFDYRNYLYSKNIKYQIYSEQYQIKQKSNPIFLPKIHLRDYIESNLSNSKRYVLTFVMADKSYFDQEIKNAISILGISHIFALSGMHIVLLVITLQIMLSKSHLKQKKQEGIIFLFLSLFMIITSFTASVVRSSLMYMLTRLNAYLKIQLSTLDIISCIMVLLLLVRPFLFYDMGFSLSFLVVYTIILGRDILTDQSKVNQLFIIGLMSMLITLPITYSFNYKINLLSLLFNVIFLPIIMLFIMPLSYILLIFPSLDSLFSLIFDVFDAILINSKLVNIATFPITFQGNIIKIIYYITLYIAVKGVLIDKVYYKTVYFVVIFMIIINPRILTVSKKIAFLDVKGDSSVLIDSRNQCNIVIDTGENDDFDSVINYLKYQGLTSIDHIFITHYHADHYGELNNILHEFDVGHVWFSDSRDLPEHGFFCGDFYIDVLETNRIWENENNNSIVLYIQVYDDIFLFTGDIEKEREMELIELFHFRVDYLKVAHHGSDTSSTPEFLDHFSPKESIIMSKKFNKYKHPHSVVIERYDQFEIPVYRTDLNGTIEFRYYFKKVYKKFYRE